jgi:hypothetical protein
MKSLCIHQTSDFFYGPNMVRNTRFHRWRHAQSLMDSAKIVMKEIQRTAPLMVFQFLAESVCQSREASATHAERQILAFYK